MNNLLSYCGLVEARISASEKDLPIAHFECCAIYEFCGDLVKFKYSEKATKVFEISTLLLSVCTVDKSKVENSQNFVAFSEYTNFKRKISLSDRKSHFSTFRVVL